MKRRARLLSLVVTGGLLAGALLAGPASVAAGGTADAAHACQQGGYAALHGTDGTTFSNAGACVAFVAKGGTITNVSTNCSYSSGTSGCVELDSVVVYTGGSGPAYTTLSGMFTFAPITTWDFFTNGTASGTGTWTSSVGTSGTWTAVNESNTQLYYPTFSDGNGLTTCAAATSRYIGVQLTMAGGGLASDSIMQLQIRVATSGTNYVLYQGFSATPPPAGEPLGIHQGTDVSGVTIRC